VAEGHQNQGQQARVTEARRSGAAVEQAMQRAGDEHAARVRRRNSDWLDRLAADHADERELRRALREERLRPRRRA
jgi:hypothetical protein